MTSSGSPIRPLIIVAFALQCFDVVAQSFVNTYGNPGAEDGIGVAQTGSGFSFGLRIHKPDEDRFEAALLSTASNGTGFSLDVIEELTGAVFLQAMARASDGSHFMTGSTIAEGESTHNGFLLKRDPAGTIDWVTQPSVVGDEQYFALALLPDGGAICAGVRRAGSGHDALATRFAADGSVVWSVTEGGPLDEEAYGVTIDGSDVLLTGRRMNFSGTSNTWFARLDLNGAVQWTTSSGGTGTEIGRAIVPLGGGAFLSVGTTNSFGEFDHTEGRIKDHVHLIAIGLTGDTLWTRAPGDTLFDRRGFDISVASNGDLLIAGERSAIIGESDGMIMRVSSAGAFIWERTWDLGKEERLLGIEALSDGLVATGWSFDAFSRQVLLIRRDPNGN